MQLPPLQCQPRQRPPHGLGLPIGASPGRGVQALEVVDGAVEVPVVHGGPELDEALVQAVAKLVLALGNQDLRLIVFPVEM